MAGTSTSISSSTTLIPIVALEDSNDGRSSSPQSVSTADTDQPQTAAVNGGTSSSHQDDEPEPGPSSSTSSVFDDFYNACASRLKLPGDEKILERLKKRYMEMDEEFRESPECENLLEGYIEQVREQPDTYIILKEVLSNFKAQANAAIDALATKKARIRQLERFLEKADREIKKLQEKEVDFEEEENSDYILECRLKARFAKVYTELCRLVGAIPSEPRAKITFNGTRYPEINRNIRKYVNRRKNEFPDFKMILDICKATNEEEDLHLSDVALEEIAREAFRGVGEELKQIRVKEFKFTLGCHLTDPIDISDDSQDPASADPSLKQKLEENEILASKRLDEVVEKFAAEQDTLKVEPVEVGDDELGSVSGSDDEEEDDGVEYIVEADDDATVDQIVEEASEDSEDVNGANGEVPHANGHSPSAAASDSDDSRPSSSIEDAPPDSVKDQPVKEEKSPIHINGHTPKEEPKTVIVKARASPVTPNSKPRILKRGLDCLKGDGIPSRAAKVPKREGSAAKEDDDCIVISD